MKILLSVLVLVIAPINSVYAEYYELTGVGDAFPWFTDTKSRSEYIGKHLGYLSVSDRNKLTANKDSRYYEPTNGDIGTLVLNLSPNEEKLIINVAGNYVQIRAKSVKKVSKKKYETYMESLNAKSNDFFGFELGKTNYAQAIKLLKSTKAKYEENLSYRGYQNKIPAVRVLSYPKLPVIEGTPVTKAVLWFYDDILYKIYYQWLPKSTNIFDIRRFNKKGLYRLISGGIIEKYKRAARKNDDFSGEYYWLNNEMHLYQRWYEEGGGFELSYVSSAVNSKVEGLKKEIDQIVEKREKEKQISNIKNQL